MDLAKKEARRDEILGFNNVIAEQLKAITEEFKKIQDRITELNNARNQLINQANINNGALAEIQLDIDELKKDEPKEELAEVVDIKDKKSKK